jgi:hypothetical protein
MRAVVYKMSEEYVSAMVTVIPIIMLVASVEVSALVRHGSWLNTRPSAADKLLMVLFLFVFASHAVTEMALIRWLATAERPESPLTARMTFVVAGFGFLAVIFQFLVLAVKRSLREEELEEAVESRAPSEQASGAQ